MYRIRNSESCKTWPSRASSPPTTLKWIQGICVVYNCQSEVYHTSVWINALGGVEELSVELAYL